jgi:4-hydroxy-3-methylbut-2-enyl diphosphate reductase
MKIIRAKVLGYCYGARRAVSMALDAAKKYPGKRVAAFGQLVHNPVADKILERGRVGVLAGADLLRAKKADVLIIRAHGVSPAVFAELKAAGYELIDATCDKIKASQKKAKTFSDQGYEVIIAGDKKHDEITGIAGFVKNPVMIENAEEAKQFAKTAGKDKPAALIGQTTMSREAYEEIAGILRAAIPGICVCDTICPVTIERQDALKELCASVDGVLVVGGKNSANTRQLLAAAREQFARAGVSAPAVLIEKADEIPRAFFSFDRIGITAGASTPDEAVHEAEAALTRPQANVI